MLELQKLIYGDRNIFISNKEIELTKHYIPYNKETLEFILTLNKLGYTINNPEVLFKLNPINLNIFKEELMCFFEEFSIDGRVFRKNFAQTLSLEKYNEEDNIAIFAQYSQTYNWKDSFKCIFGKSSKKILKDYNKVIPESSTIIKSNRSFVISFNKKEDLGNICKNSLESNIILREQQIKTIENMPTNILFKVYKESKIIIKEIEVLVLTLLIKTKNYSFITLMGEDLNILFRFIVSNYSYYKDSKIKYEDISQLNKNILKSLKVKLPTSIKKEIADFLENGKEDNYINEIFKFSGYWKKIFTACRWTNADKMKNRFPQFCKLKDLLYKNDRSNTFNSKVEQAKLEGNYDKAIRILSTNPGYMIRNLMEYIRYIEVGTKIAKKKRKKVEETIGNIEKEVNDFSNNIDLSDIMKETRGLSIPLEVELDDNKVALINKEDTKSIYISSEKMLSHFSTIGSAKSNDKKMMEILENNVGLNYFLKIDRKVEVSPKDFLYSKDFINVLKLINTKLLWQFITLLNSKTLYKDRNLRNVQGVEVLYEDSNPLPKISKKVSKKIKKQIKIAINTIKMEENKNLGKVYLGKDLKNYNIQFSGRKSKEIVLSGEYLSPGSKIDIKSLIKEEGKILRLGVAWKGEASCDIDHSLNLLTKNEVVYYGKPEYIINEDGDEKPEVVITSSGDIVKCSNDIFSTELIDIDIDKAKQYNLGKMVTSLIQYEGKSFDNYEVFFFINVIDKKDRIIAGQKITIKLDQMQYAIQITEETKSVLGVLIDLDKEKLEVLNIPVNDSSNFGVDFDNYNNAETLKDIFDKMILERPPLLSIKKALNNVINPMQIVKNIEDADIVITSKDVINNIHPMRNLEKLQKIIF